MNNVAESLELSDDEARWLTGKSPSDQPFGFSIVVAIPSQSGGAPIEDRSRGFQIEHLLPDLRRFPLALQGGPEKLVRS
ncbi:MAG: hypothetical protein ACLGI9_12540, partial [Thermoanaerobaculia bacterium]